MQLPGGLQRTSRAAGHAECEKLLPPALVALAIIETFWQRTELRTRPPGRWLDEAVDGGIYVFIFALSIYVYHNARDFIIVEYYVTTHYHY